MYFRRRTYSRRAVQQLGKEFCGRRQSELRHHYTEQLLERVPLHTTTEIRLSELVVVGMLFGNRAFSLCRSSLCSYVIIIYTELNR